ncbi:EAL domain-containing protein [Motiliproteus coralliicola]|uniref:EAL domain-containing protein n=1 Tax=Motiliproteus coralliicola TaxID=2283196 RepID=A0A369WN74_9GAMM|nr:EAL domain-containing protein [Motiliproteus coralliicola]RDE22519.1 EAL domain-containing protein [Motiliproteus coralliicola]
MNSDYTPFVSITSDASIALGRLTLDLVSAHDEKEIYAKLAESLPKMLSADRSSVTLLTDSQEEFEIFALHGENGALPLGKSIPVNNTLAGIAATKVSTCWHDIEEDETSIDGQQLYQQGIKSIINSPLIFSNKVIGTVNIGSYLPQAYDQNSAGLLTLIASLVSTYLERQRLLIQAQLGVEQYRLYSEQLTVLNQIAAKLAAANSEQCVFKIIKESISKVIPAQRISYVVINHDSYQCEVKTIYNDKQIQMPTVIDINDSALMPVLDSGQALFFDDTTITTSDKHKHLAKQGIRAAWSVPVRISDRIAGILNVGTFDPISQGDQQLKLLNMFSGIMGVTLSRVCLQSELERQASYDNLTGLPNRALLHQKLASVLATPSPAPFTLLFIDLDRFKQVNDSLGHNVGDELLRQVTRRVYQQIRKQDFIARLGGDEFVVLLADCGSEEVAHTTSKRIIETLKAPFSIERHHIFIGASIGISSYPKHGLDPEELLKYADIAMYQAKKHAHDNFHFYSDALLEIINSNRQIESQLRLALNNNQLNLVFQPLIGNDQVIGVESLLRWNHAELGQVSPDSFIPVAEESLLICDITSWVLEKSLRTLTGFREYLPELYVSVNISGKDCLDLTKLKTRVIRALEKHQLPGSALKLELTESIFLQNIDDIKILFTELKQLGVRLAIDDFGTGFSSLAYLLNLPLDQIKIDRSFIADIDTDPAKYGVVKGITDIAKSLKIDCLAEGVETQAQKKALERMGCNHFQGYLFSRPLPTNELANLLKLDTPN